MAAARSHPRLGDRLVIEMLARTGLRAGELCDLAADAATQIGGAHWLRVPVGKLRNDRYIPLHSDLITLLAEWTTVKADHIRTHRRLIADHAAALYGRLVHYIVKRMAKRAGIAPVTPTSSATPWPPRRPTGACDWKRSPPSSDTARWR